MLGEVRNENGEVEKQRVNDRIQDQGPERGGNDRILVFAEGAFEAVIKQHHEKMRTDQQLGDEAGIDQAVQQEIEIILDGGAM